MENWEKFPYLHGWGKWPFWKGKWKDVDVIRGHVRNLYALGSFLSLCYVKVFQLHSTAVQLPSRIEKLGNYYYYFFAYVCHVNAKFLPALYYTSVILFFLSSSILCLHQNKTRFQLSKQVVVKGQEWWITISLYYFISKNHLGNVPLLKRIHLLRSSNKLT